MPRNSLHIPRLLPRHLAGGLLAFLFSIFLGVSFVSAESRGCYYPVSIGTTWKQVICPNTGQMMIVEKPADHTVNMPAACPGSSSAGQIVTSSPVPITYTGGGSGSGSSGQSGGGASAGSGQAVALAQEECASPSCPVNKNTPQTQECTGSSVIMANGTYTFGESDLTLPSPGLGFDWDRSYRSNRILTKPTGAVFGEPGDGPLGFGWTNIYISRIDNGDTWTDGDGLVYTFTKDANGILQPSLKDGLSLQKTADGYQLTNTGNYTQRFNQAGQLISITDLNNNTQTLTYDGNNRLSTIRDARATLASFTSDTNGRIATITDRSGRIVSYQYDSLGNLTQATLPGDRTHRYTYNSNHGLTSKANPLGETYTIAYQYPDKGVVSKILDPIGSDLAKQGKPALGHEISFRYDFGNGILFVTDYTGTTRKKTVNKDGALLSEELLSATSSTLKKVEYLDNRIERHTDSAGIVTLYQKDEWDNTTRITNGEGQETRISYNQTKQPVSIIDPLGIITKLDYDTTGNLITSTRAQGTPDQTVTTNRYDTQGNLIASTTGSATTSISYNDNGLPITISDPEGGVTRLSYDSIGNLTAITDPKGNTTSYQYDSAGNRTAVRNALNQTTSYSYNLAGRIAAITDPLSRTTSLESDFNNNITKLTPPTGSATSYQYDANGNITSITKGNATTTRSYDATGRLISITDAEGNTTRYDYAGAGCSSCGGSSEQPRLITDPLGNNIERTFDKAGRLKASKDPLGNTTSLTLDPLGRVLAVTDANSTITRLTRNPLGRIITKTDGNSNTTNFSYDSLGNLTSLVDQNGNRTSFDYDKAGRQTRETRPLGQNLSYSYYPNGLLKTATDPKGQTTSYVYDANNRLIETSYADGTKDTFSYDAAGNMITYARPGISASMQYDQLNRKTEETVNYGPFSKTYRYSYDSQGNKQTFSTPEGKTYSYSYNSNNQVTQITADGKTISLDYQWIRQTKTTLPNNTTTDYQYNANNWLAAIETKQNSSTLQSQQNSFDNIGNIVTKATEQGTTAYAYDKTYQLTQANGPSQNETFSYDKAGNRTSNNSVSNANNQLTTTSTATYSYDNNGNTLTKTENSQTTQYSYDARDRLTQVTVNGQTINYAYDPFNRRIKKQTPTETTYYLYAEEGLIGEYSETGTPKKTYSWLPDSTWGTNPVTLTENNKTYYFHNDHLGTPQKLTDEQGMVVWQASYEAFGKATITTATITNNLRFPGQYYDEETGLHYNWNRYYDPQTGRYTQEDLIRFNAGDENLYRYVQNNPINWKDPYGLEASFGGGYGFTMFGGWGNSAWGVDVSVGVSISSSGVTVSAQGTNISEAYGGYVGWGRQGSAGFGNPCSKGGSSSQSNSFGVAGGWGKGGSASVSQGPDGLSFSGGAARVGGGYGGGVWQGQTATGSWSWNWR